MNCFRIEAGFALSMLKLGGGGIRNNGSRPLSPLHLQLDAEFILARYVGFNSVHPSYMPRPSRRL
jgi:hypothetical protein